MERFEKALDILQEFDYMPDPERLFHLTSDSGCTSYDCSYVALAKDRNIRLVTADKEVLKAFGDCAISMEDFIR